MTPPTSPPRPGGKPANTAPAAPTAPAERYGDLLALMPDAMLVVDGTGVVVALNALAEGLFGYARDELIGRSVDSLVPEAYRQAHAARREGYMAAAWVRPMGLGPELYARRQDGSEFPVEISLRPLPDSDAPLVAATVRDLSERKTIELALKLSEERLNEAASIARLGHYVWSADENEPMPFCSEEYARIFGMTAEECRRRHATRDGVLADIHPDDRARYIREGFDDFLEDAKPREITCRIVHPDGSIRHIREKWRAITDEGGQATGAIGTIQDVTDEVAARESLAENEARLVQAAQISEIGHFEWDTVNNRLAYCSEEYARIFDRPVEALLGEQSSAEDDVSFAHPDDRERLRQALYVDGVETPGPIDIEYRIVRPDGEVRHVHERDEPEFDANGRLVRYVGTLQDITGRKRTEQRLREAERRHELAARLAHLGHYVWDDVADELTFCSEEYTAIQGFSLDEYRTRARERGDGHWFIHRDDRERYDAVFEKQFESKSRDFELEYRIVRPDGTVRHVHEAGETDYDGSGRAIRSIGAVQDVTERVNAEQALRDRERYLGDAARIAGLGHYAWAANPDRMTFCSEEYAAIFDATPEECLVSHSDQDRYFALVHPDDRVRYEAVAYNGVSPAWPDVEIEYRIVRPDGEVRHLVESSHTEFDGNGEAGRSVGVMLDITERKRAEFALRDSERKYRTLVENAQIGLVRTRAEDGKVIDANPVVARIYGCESPQAFIESFRLAEHFVDPGERVALVEEIRRTGRVENREIQVTRADGAAIWVRYSAELDRERDELIGVVADITAEKHARESLHESEERLAEAARIARLGHYIWDDRADCLIYCSREYARIHGRSVGELLYERPSHDADLELIHPDDRERYDYEAYEGVTAAGSHLDIEYRILLPNRVIRHIHEIGETTFDDAGNPIRTVGTIQDITDRKEAETLLREKDEQLEHAAAMARLGHYVWDEVADRLIHFSGEYAAIHGLSVEEMLAMAADTESDAALVHPDDREEYLAVIRTVPPPAKPRTEHQYRIVRPDGAVRHLHEICEIEFDANAKAVRSVGTIQDVTERVVAEQKIRDSEERLAEAAQIAKLGHFVFSKDGDGRRLEMVSPDYARIFGLSAAECEMRFSDVEHLLAAVHPDDRERFRQAITTDLTPDKSDLNITYRIVRPDGTVRHIHERGRLVWNTDGSFRKIFGTIQDITAEREADEALRDSEQRLAAAARVAKLGHFVWDEIEQKLVVCTDEYARIFGFSADDLESGANDEPSDLETVHPDDRDAYHEAVYGGMAKDSPEPVEHDYRILRPDGEVRHLHLYIEPVFDADGRIVRSMGTVQDITERVLTEEKVRDSEARLAAAARVAKLGHFVWDEIEQKLIIQTEELGRIYGFTGEQLQTGASDEQSDLETVHPDDRDAYHEAVYGGLAKDNPEPVEHDYRIVRPDGEVRHLHLYIEPVFDAGGRIVRSMGTVQDVTDRALAERKVRDSEARLAEAARMARLGHYIFSKEGGRRHLAMVSDEYARIFGCTVEECLETHADFDKLLAFVHPDDHDLFRRASTIDLMPGKGPLDITYRIVRPDKTERYVHERGEPTWAADGSLLALSGTIQDVTEEREAGEALRKSQARYAEAARLAQLGHFEWDHEEDRLTFCSEEYARIFGRTVEEMQTELGTPEADIDMAHPDDRERFRQAVYVEAVRDKSPIDFEYRIVRPDGEVRIVHELAEPVLDDEGRLLRFVGTLRDITEEQLAAAALRESEAKFRGVLDNLPGAVFRHTVGEVRTFTFMSTGIRDLAGYEPGELIGRQTKFLVHPDDYAELAEAALEHMESGLPMSAEYRIRHKDGSAVWVREISRVVTDAAGESTSFDGMLIDISERRAAEAALQESQLILTLSQQLAKLGHWVLNLSDGRFTTASPDYLGFWGLSPDDADALESLARTHEHIHPEDRPGIEAHDAALLKNPHDFTLEFRTLRPDGEIRYYLERGAVIRDKAGKPVSLLGSTQDVTELKQIEQQLRRSEIEFRGIFEGMPLSVWYEDWSEPKRIVDGLRAEGVTDFEAYFREHPEIVQEIYNKTGVLRFNQATLDLYRTDAETLRRDIDDPEQPDVTLFGEDLAAYGGALAALARGEFRVSFDSRERDYENRALTVRSYVHVPPEFRDDWSRVVVTSEDITAVKNTEDALRRSEIEFRGIFDAMPLSVWYEDWSQAKQAIEELRRDGVTDFHGYFRAHPERVREIHEKVKTLRINSATLDMFKTDEETLLREVDDFDFDEEIMAFGDLLAELAGGEFRANYEFPNLDYENRELTLRGIVHIPREFHDDWSRATSVLEDVTEIRSTEEQLRQSQKMEAVGQLTGGVAHDFNNLLGIIMGNAELLADGLEDERLRNHADAIERAANRGAELTHGLLAFSRRQELSPRRVELSELVDGLTRLLGRTLGATITIETALADADLLADIDPGQLENALINLAINARDAMPEGGTVTIETSQVELDEAAAARMDVAPGAYVVLSVADTGTGMPPEVQDRAFEPFFTTKETGKGTGLGLSMIYGFVRQSSGQVTIDSAPDHGTVIRLFLPAAEAGAEADEAAVDAELPMGRGETVLLVEDNPDFRDLSIQLIEGLGYRVVAADDAAAAIDALNAEPALDLVLTDVVLPGGKSGADVARAARAHRAGMPVIFMSGYTAGHLDVIRGEQGFESPLIAKPFTRSSLAERLREALAANTAV